MEDIMVALFHFYHTEKLEKNFFSASFIALIPKKAKTEDWWDFGPISLIRSFDKIIATHLTERLKRVIGKACWLYSNDFHQRRQIMDVGLITKEISDTRQKQGKPGVICKLD